MNKRTVKTKIAEAKKNADALREYLQSMSDEFCDAIEEIEPYDGNYDLTEAQSKKAEFIQDLQDQLDYLVGYLEDFNSEVDNILENEANA